MIITKFPTKRAQGIKGRQSLLDKSLLSSRYEKLYNSVGKILLLETKDEAPVMLATKGSAGGDKYLAGKIGIGDEKTFSKGEAAKGKKVGLELLLNVQESFKDMKGAVEKVLKMIVDGFETELEKDRRAQ